jgi:hypothetical protein
MRTFGKIGEGFAKDSEDLLFSCYFNAIAIESVFLPIFPGTQHSGRARFQGSDPSQCHYNISSPVLPKCGNDGVALLRATPSRSVLLSLGQACSVPFGLAWSTAFGTCSARNFSASSTGNPN